MTPIRNFAVFVSMAALLASAAAAAVPETPSLKPGKAAAVQPPASVLSINTSASAGLPVIAPLPTTPLPVLTQKSGSVLYLARALSAAERNQWTELSALQYAAPDPVLKNLIMWKRASEGVPGMTFDELNLALDHVFGDARFAATPPIGGMPMGVTPVEGIAGDDPVAMAVLRVSVSSSPCNWRW